jgi:hypothetical protein
MSDLDKIRQAFPDLRDASDSEVLGEISRLTNVRFEDVADVFGVAPRGTLGESVRQLGAGLAVDLPRMVGQSLKYTGLAPELGERMVQSAEERAPGWTPDMRGRGAIGQALTSGARALGPVGASVPLFFVPGGQVAAPLAIGGVFGTSAAQDTYEKLTEQGVSEEAAKAAARRVGLLQGGGEAAATVVGARLVMPAVRGLRGAQTTAQVARGLTDERATRVLVPFAQRFATNIGVQAGTEAAQDVGTELIERAYGARPEDIGEIAEQSALAGAGMAAWLGPFTFGGSVSRARRSEELKQALYGENVDPRVRAQAIDVVMAEAQRQNIAPENVEAWFEQQLQIEDARTEALRQAEERARAQALASRDKSLEDMVKQQGLTRGLTDQDLLTPGVTSAQIEREMGIRRKSQDPKKYAANFTQAFNEPSGQFVSDPETGVERELTMGEYYQRQGGVLDLMQEEPTKAAVATDVATQSLRDPRSLFLRDTLGIVPTASALRLVDAIEQSGIPLDSDLAAPIVTYAAEKTMGAKRLERALQMLDAAIIEARRTPQQEVVPVVSTPGVSESAGVLPAAGVSAAGLSQGAPVAATPSIAPAPAAAAQITAAPSPAPAAAPAVQEQGAPAVDTVVDDGYANSAEAWDDFRPDDAPAFDALAPALQQAWIQARVQGELSRPLAEQIIDANREDSAAGVDPRVLLLSRLYDGKNAVRDAEMLIDRMAMGMPLREIAEKYNLGIARVGQIVGDEKEGARRREAMLERARARGLDLNEVQDALRSLAEEGQARGELDIQNMFGDVEATEADAAQADLGTRASSVGGGGANVGKRLNNFEKRTIDVLTQLQNERSPQRRAELEAELAQLVQDAKAQERKTQAKIRATAGRQSEKDRDLETEQARATARAELGAEDAIQEQTTAEVPVQPEAQAGQRVGRQVRRAQEPAAEGQVLTSQETYAQVVSGVPGAPTFDSLTKAQQSQITDLANAGQLNLAAVNRIVEGAPDQSFIDSVSRGMTRAGGITDLNGANVSLTPTTPEALSRVAAVAEVFEAYRQAGQDNAIAAVESWYVTDTPVTWDGVFAMVDGKPSVILNARILMTLPQESAWTVRHEIGHAIDQVQFGGAFSSSELFNVSVTQDRIIPRGQLMQDVVAFRDANPDSELGRHLKYPLDMQHTGRLSVDELRQEVFGQLWAFYSTSEANRNFMEDNLPFVFDYFDGVVNETVKSTAYGSEATSPTEVASDQEQAAAQAESVEPRPLRSTQQVQGVVRAHTRQPAERVKNLNRIPAPARGAANSIVSALRDIGARALDRAVFTSDLTRRAVDLGMQSANRLQRSLAARDFMAREESRAVESILNGYVDLTETERGAGEGSVNRFLFDSTRTGKWGYGDRADAEMATRFDAFSPAAKKFIQDIFAHGDRMLQRKKDIVLNATRSEFDAQIANAKTDKEKAELRKAKQLALKRYETLFRIREGRPYAPIKRTGNYVVIAKSREYMEAEASKDEKRIKELESDGDHYHVSFTDGKRTGQELRRQLEEQGVFADVQLAERDQATDELFSNESALQQLAKLRSNVDARVQGGEKEAGKMLGIINQMYLEALAEGSARKSEMRRRGVDAEVDMIASFAHQGNADANFLASLQYNDQVNDALNAMRKEAKTGDRTRKSEVLNELVRRYSDSLDVPDNPMINKLLRVSSVYFLASSPAYYLQNLTQPFMMSVPAMAGEHSYAKVNNELYKAYTELGPVMRSAKFFSQQFDYKEVPADVRNAINELVNRGRIDIGLDTELGEFQIDGSSKLGAKWNQVDKGLRMMVQKGEAVNRLSTAIAAYRLAMSKEGATAEQAIDYADRILLETHGDYSRYNAPRFFNHPVGRVALQFRKFQLIQLSWYAKLIRQIPDPVQRGAALRSLAFGVAHTGVLAGAMGLPGYAAAAWALGMIFGDEDEPFDLTDSIRKMIGDEEVANVVLRGAPTLGGGDWSGKIGAGNMLSVMPFSNADITTRAGFYEALGTLAGGASGGMVVRGIDGLGLLANGDYMKGFELLLPKGLGDVIKAYRLGTDGATRRNGDVVLPADELNGLEVMWQAIGIPPAQMSEMYEKQQRVRNVEQRFRERTTRIKNDYTKAMRERDTAAAAEARQAWMNLQAARVKAGLKRQPMSELIRAPREQAKRERETAGGVQFRKGTERMVEDIVER